MISIRSYVEKRKGKGDGRWKAVEFRWFQASCKKREKGEEGKMRIGMDSQRGGWVLGEGERVGGVGK